MHYVLCCAGRLTYPLESHTWTVLLVAAYLGTTTVVIFIFMQSVFCIPRSVLSVIVAHETSNDLQMTSSYSDKTKNLDG